VAAAASLLELNPFDQPDVQATKEHTRRALLGVARNIPVPRGPIVDARSDDLPAALAEHLRRVRKRSYVALCAFFASTPKRQHLLDALRAAVLARYGIATTVGYGPRYLHSTGQLHKGGPATILPIVLTADDADEESIPGTDYTFGMLKAAQADGDAEALRLADRPVLRVHLGDDVEGNLRRLRELIEARPVRRQRARAATAGH
jgi:transaldolase/glucose-6-phosphate isomerase